MSIAAPAPIPPKTDLRRAPRQFPGVASRGDRRSPGFPNRHSAFTLVELLVVIVIMLLLIGLASNALNLSNASRELAVGGHLLARQFDQARQLAITRNQYVQLRFYSPSGDTGVTRIGTFLAESPYYGSDAEYTTWTASGKFQAEGRDFVISEGQIIPGEAQASNLINLLRNDSTLSRTGTAITGGEAHDFVAFYFRPDGTPDFQWLNGGELPPDDAYISLVQESRYLTSKPDLPSNFFTLVFIPATGRTLALRP